MGKLVDELVDVFRAAYIGIGAHPRLLHHAIKEIQSYMRRIYKVIRLVDHRRVGRRAWINHTTFFYGSFQYFFNNIYFDFL